jgi:hypothetical protein
MNFQPWHSYYNEKDSSMDLWRPSPPSPPFTGSSLTTTADHLLAQIISDVISTASVSHKLPPIRIALDAEGGTSRKFVLNSDAEGAVNPGFDELTVICKQWASESEEFSGRCSISHRRTKDTNSEPLSGIMIMVLYWCLL